MAKRKAKRVSMTRGFDNMFTESFVDGAARAAFVLSWADHEEEAGRTYPGRDLMDVAPDTPLSAYAWAGELIGQLEALNKKGIHEIGYAAASADGVDWEDFDGNDFGHYMAMEALGTGVAWTDDHEKLPFKLKMPFMEYMWFPD